MQKLKNAWNWIKNRIKIYPQELLVIAIILFFTIAMVWSVSTLNFVPPAPKPSLTITPIPAGLSVATLVPPEYQTNYKQTIGILLGGIVLVIVVLIGTLAVIRKK
jgi:CDP-diglyceride synthetase